LQLHDARFAYAVRLECPTDREGDSREVLGPLIESLEPIPAPSPAPGAEAFNFWAT
jgi:hypothetical protein